MRTSGQQLHTYPRLAALRERLASYNVEMRLEMGALIVIARTGRPRPADVVTCQERRDDGGTLWFFTSWGDPIAGADDVVDAAMRIAATLDAEPAAFPGAQGT